MTYNSFCEWPLSVTKTGQYIDVTAFAVFRVKRLQQISCEFMDLVNHIRNLAGGGFRRPQSKPGYGFFTAVFGFSRLRL